MHHHGNNQVGGSRTTQSSVSGDSAPFTPMVSSSLGPLAGPVSMATVADGNTTLSVGVVWVDWVSVCVARELLLLVATEVVVVCSDVMSSELLELVQAAAKRWLKLKNKLQCINISLHTTFSEFLKSRKMQQK